MSPAAGYIVQTFLALAAVCGLAVFVLWAARRAGVGRPNGPIELVGRLPLEARRSIYLVKVGEVVLVIGAGEGGFTKLGEVPAEGLSALAGPASGGIAGGLSFGEILARAVPAVRAKKGPKGA
jgi:flagellar biogenesis protein FliO